VSQAKDFRIGQRVKLTEYAIERGILGKCPQPVFGTVAGFARNPVHIWVRRDGTKTARSYHRNFWEPTADILDEVNSSFARLRANPTAWAEELSERQAWFR
jgi:hypothetical protein